MKVTIDRFEGDFAVCERTDRTTINISRKKLPEEAKEGDVLVIKGEEIRIESRETAQRKETIDRLMKKLWK